MDSEKSIDFSANEHISKQKYGMVEGEANIEK